MRRRLTGWRGAASANQVLAIVCVGIVLANLDLFIVNVGLPSIAREFRGASLESLSWTLNGYAIVYAALLVFFGRLAERHRRDRSFLLGVALFTVASAGCAAAQGVATLVLARAVQAAGAALMTPTSIGLLLASFPPERRPGAVRTWAAIGGFAAALGPMVGGLLVTFSWRWIFLVNVPIGIAAIAVAWWWLPAVPGHDAPRPKAIPAALVTIGIGALVLAIVKINDWGWVSFQVAAVLAIAAACLALFVRHCLTDANPFIEPSLFRVRSFTGATLTMVPFSTAFGAMLLSLALWEQTGWGWSALKAGLVIAPGPLLVPIVSLSLAGRLLHRFGAAAVLVAGVVVFSASLALLAGAVGPAPSIPVAAAGIMLSGVGVGLVFPTLMGVGAGSLPPSQFATGSGVINMIRQAGLAIGVAVFVAIIGVPATPAARLAAYHAGWWTMAAVTLVALIPVAALVRERRPVAEVVQAT